MDEIAVIESARKGSLESFNCLVLSYQDQVYRQAYHMLGDKDLAEDATQDAFISAYKNLRGYRGGSFRAWLMRIVTNLCYDELRRRKRRPTIPLEPSDDEGDEIESPRWMADEDSSTEARIESAELNLAIRQCLDSLPPGFRDVVVLVDVQGMDYAEAAQATGKPLGTVKSRLARARMRLRDCLRGYRELLPGEFRQGDEQGL